MALQNGEAFTARHDTARFWEEEPARAAYENLTDTARVTEVKEKSATRPAPVPFNTTGFLSAAANIGISPSRAARLAEDLYTDGYISYPRTDNTVYPGTLDCARFWDPLEGRRGWTVREKLLHKRGALADARQKETTDHRRSTHRPRFQGRAAEMQWKIYQLVVRRSFWLPSARRPRPCSRRCLWSRRGASGRGRHGRTQEGWLAYNPTAAGGRGMPSLSEARGEGDRTSFCEGTQPPSDRTGRLIRLMEILGSARRRRARPSSRTSTPGHVHDDPLVPTETGIAFAGPHGLRLGDSHPRDDRRLERSMDEISEGKVSKDSVVDRSRDGLRQVDGNLESSQEEFADIVRSGIREDSVLGPCKKCGRNLTVRRARKSGKRFAGCEGYPECDQTYSLPPRGEIIPLGTLCEACGSPEIKVVGGRRPWITCIDMQCPKQQERRKAAAEAKAAKAEAKATAGPESNGSTEGGERVSKTTRKRATSKA